MWVFDLDGTLVDTRKAVEEAYHLAGVHMPPEMWGRPWQQWLNNARVHSLKNKLYHQTLRQYGVKLPLLEVALQLDAPVLTGASSAAVRTIMQRWASGLNIALVEATPLMKAVWLNQHEPGTYVDDSEHTRAVIREKTQWRVMTPTESLQLFSPRGKVRD